MNGEESNVQRVVVDKSAFSNANSAKSLGGASGAGARIYTTGIGTSSRGANNSTGFSSSTGLLIVLLLGAIIIYALSSFYGGFGALPGYAYPQPYGGGGPFGFNNQYYGF